MTVNSISTLSLSGIGPGAIRQLQKEMSQAQTEMTTGRKADIDAQLGYQAGAVTSLSVEQSRLEAQISSNAIISTRLEGSQAAMTAVSQSATGFMNALLSSSQGEPSAALVAAAQGALGATSSALNTAIDGTYLFAGINTATAPLNNYYSTPQSAARTAMIAEFSQVFGFAPSDPAAANISASSMQAFVDNNLSQAFAGPNWNANWSGATDAVAQNRVSTSETVTTSASINEAPFRQMVQAYAIIAEFGSSALNPAAMSTLVRGAVKLTGAATGGLTQIQSRLGDAQTRIATSNGLMKIQADILSRQVDAITGVDASAAAERVASLTTQIEAAYSLTAQIERLSLVNSL